MTHTFLVRDTIFVERSLRENTRLDWNQKSEWQADNPGEIKIFNIPSYARIPIVFYI